VQENSLDVAIVEGQNNLSRFGRYRRLSILAAFAVMLAGCNRSEPVNLQTTVEEPKPLASVLRVSDPSISGQLLSGFGAVEANSWRWVGPNFAVALGVPPGVAASGASVVLDFSLPDASVKILKRVTISGRVGDAALSPETYDTPGAHKYQREIPATALKADNVQVQFNVDKFIGPSEADRRQLSLVVSSIQLQPK
jgi:hypothetical protein